MVSVTICPSIFISKFGFFRLCLCCQKLWTMIHHLWYSGLFIYWFTMEIWSQMKRMTCSCLRYVFLCSYFYVECALENISFFWKENGEFLRILLLLINSGNLQRLYELPFRSCGLVCVITSPSPTCFYFLHIEVKTLV